MRGQYLVAVDLEGIHGVVGTPYEGLVFGSQEYEKAVENAIDEVNAVVKGLFEGGANLVAVWDNHGGKKNLDPNRSNSPRSSFSHSRESSLRYGVTSKKDTPLFIIKLDITVLTPIAITPLKYDETMV